MATNREGQQIISHDHNPAGTVVRPTAKDDDTPRRPVSAWVVVIASEDSSVARYTSWLADTYETQTVRRGETMSTPPETEVVVVDQRKLTMAGESARGTVGPRHSDCRVLAPATLQSCDSLVDEYIPEPVDRDGLLSRIRTAMRIATYDGTIAELLLVTMRRRKLRNCSRAGHDNHASDIASLSERIDELHRRIDDELSDVESHYAALLGSTNRPSTRQKTENERT